MSRKAHQARQRSRDISAKEGMCTYIKRMYREGYKSSRHADREAAKSAGLGANDYAFGKIYSKNSRDQLIKIAKGYSAWLDKSLGHAASLKDAKKLANRDAYIKHLISEGQAPDTVQNRIWGLRKIFLDQKWDPRARGIEVPVREREKITRSRLENSNTSRWQMADGSIRTQYMPLHDFVVATGLRRNEVDHVTFGDLYRRDGQLCIHVGRAAKGGREREVPIAREDEQAVTDWFRRHAEHRGWTSQEAYREHAGDKLLSHKVDTHLPTHRWRAEYAARRYKALARPLGDIPSREKMHMRKELKGLVIDRKAAEAVSRLLGHSRVDVATRSYIYMLDFNED